MIFEQIQKDPIVEDDDNKGQRLAQIALGKIKDEDIIHRGFLKPIEIALKTYKTQKCNKQNQGSRIENGKFVDDEDSYNGMQMNSLPQGLKIVVKKSICDNRYSLKDVAEVDDDLGYDELKINCQDNILSLMKNSAGIQLAICICMYSEDKKMLKSTLAGVAQNIAHLVFHQSICPDKIGVFVIMDGIQKVSPSVVEYFQELERANSINLGQNTPTSLTIEELAKRVEQMTEDQINEQQFKNINNFLFDVAELQDRNERRFPSVKAQFQEIKSLLITIQQLKKKKTNFDDLPGKIRRFFFQEARQTKKINFALSQSEVRQISQSQLIEQYANDTRKSRPIVFKALNECQRFCKEYIASREDLAFLACFRNQISYQQDEEQIEESQNHSNNGRRIVDTSTVMENDIQIKKQDLKTKMNLFLCVKYKNSGKLSSHNWFLNGFCKQLRPKYSVLLDVGLKPQGQSLYKMYKYMKVHKRVGGVCGYMSLKIEQLQQQDEQKLSDIDCLSQIMLKVADIQRTQQVQYHFAHLMDKAFEASFGFIHVLPGAFSAYNMQAIYKYDQPEDDRLLRSYFKSIDQKIANYKISQSRLNLQQILLRVALPDYINSCFLNIQPDSEEQMLYNQNIYLAQDRILCMGIHKRGYEIAFLPDAYAEVDPIKTVHGLLGQRKRWINGSFFAFQKVKSQLGQHQAKTGYQFCLNFQILYLSIMNALSYFAPSFFLFTVHIAMDAFRVDILVHVFGGMVGDANNSQIFKAFVYTVDFIYVMLILSIIFFSLHLTNNSKHFKPYIYAISTIFGIFSISVFMVLIIDVFNGLLNNSAFLITNAAFIQTLPGGIASINAMRWILIASTLIYALPILIYIILFKKLHILCQVIMGAFSFLFYGPTYLNILNIYSLCRIDDISWGTKGLQSGNVKNSQLKQSWSLIKYIHVSKFIIWNIIVSVMLLVAGADYQPRFFITITMVSLMALTLSLKIIVAVIYLFSYKIHNCQNQKKSWRSMRCKGSKIDNLINYYKPTILDQIKNLLYIMANKYNKYDFKLNGRSFIQLSKTNTHIEKAFRKQNNQFYQRSKITQLKDRSEQDRTTRNRQFNNIMFNLPISTNNALDNLSVAKPVDAADKKVSFADNLPDTLQESLQQFVQPKFLNVISKKNSKKNVDVTFSRFKPED